MASHLHGAMNGDLVELAHLRSLEQRRRDVKASDWTLPTGRQRREHLGSVRRVLERAHQSVIGVLEECGGLRLVRPNDERIPYDIFIDPKMPGKSGWLFRDGDVVVVRLTTWPTRHEAASGYIEELIGSSDDSGIDSQIILRQHGFDTVFPAAALDEAKALSLTVAEAGDDGRLPRRDLQGQLLFTIDPEDAKDFDDALSADFVDGQLLLGVHIADVSAFVAADSSLDKEALARATSVYLPDQVVPMLPPQLSDELCSLKAGEQRLAFTVQMLMAADGSVLRSEFFPSLIKSAARLSYGQVDEVLAASKGTRKACPPEVPGTVGATALPAPAASSAAGPDVVLPIMPVADPEVVSRLLVLDRLAHKLKRRRLARGAIDFDSVEPKLTLDDQGRPIAVCLRRPTPATSLVEEAMILANEQVAAFMLAHKAPMAYRIHEAPCLKTLAEVVPVLREFDYPYTDPPATSAQIQEILEASAQRQEYHLLSSLLLRSMKRASYAPCFTEHFGLASKAYCHFTSPIRRYPDLLVHRLLKLQLSGVGFPATLIGQLESICQQSAERERAAESATRQATAAKLVEFLSPHVGERFKVSVVGVNVYGLVVREQTTSAEGYVEKECLPKGLVLEPDRYRWADPEGTSSIRLGQILPVVLAAADRKAARLYFALS